MKHFSGNNEVVNELRTLDEEAAIKLFTVL